MDEPDYTMAEIAVLVGRDPGMATRFLRIVNSPLNRRVHKIETVSHAVSMLGMGQIHDIVLSASVGLAFEGIQMKLMNMNKFWQRSFYCAMMAKQLALECGNMESDKLFVNGLLHDIGHLFMYLSIPKESQQAILNARKQDRPLYQVERELLGFDYAKLGGYVMGQWDLPQSLRTITCFHPEPARTHQFALETAVLHLSSLLVISDLEKRSFGKGSFTVDPTVWTTTRLTEEQCLNLRQITADQFGEVTNSLFL
ncbi:MAG: HDOD domain-containing protein [Desulfobacterium sp.]|nr:HDOD domain-containing protein [Desulfobacterium sp.]